MADNSEEGYGGLDAAITSEALERQFEELYPKTHTGIILLLSARLENQVAAIIRFHMAPLGKNQRARLFEGKNAPLSTFSAKVEIALALRLIDSRTYQSLIAIKDIRNKFAHHDQELSFDSTDEDVAARFRRLPGSIKRSQGMAFLETVQEVNQALGKIFDRFALASALLGEHLSSPDKSPGERPPTKGRVQDRKKTKAVRQPPASPASPRSLKK